MGVAGLLASWASDWPQSRARSRATFRSGFEPDDDYLAASGAASGCSPGSILSLACHGTRWLTRQGHGEKARAILARVGGDEFALLLPNTGLQGAWELISRLQRALAGREVVADGVAAGRAAAEADLEHIVGGHVRRVATMTSTDMKSLLAARSELNQALTDNPLGDTFTDICSAHEDYMWEVKAADGTHQGLFYFDIYARTGKRSGAWMSSYRDQDGLGESGHSPIIHNNSNFVKGAPGEPVLISWDDARTFFHEFGHNIGLNHVAIHRDLALAQGRAIDSGAEGAADQALDFLRAPGLLAGSGLAPHPGMRGAGQHPVFRRHPTLAGIAHEGRHAFFECCGA